MKYSLIFVFGLVLSCKALPNGWSFATGPYNIENNGTSLEFRCAVGVNEESEKFSTLLNVTQTLDSNVVTQLKLRDCDLSIVAGTIELFPHLIELDISSSNYESLDSLHLKHEQLVKFNASHNEIFGIRKQFFEGTPKIDEIDFSYNKLERIESDTFKGAAVEPSRIHLKHNELVYIENGAFVNLSKLEFLDLSYNMMTSIDQIFKNNQNLRELHLENNPIAAIDCNILSLFSQTISVLISWGNVETLNLNCINGKLINHANDTEMVSSTDNAEGHFYFNEKSFQNLRFFIAGSNVIEKLHEFLMFMGTSIEYLDLSGTNLETLNDTVFQRFTNLRRLKLHGTQLKVFDLENLKLSNKLVELDISNNNLKTVKNPLVLESKRLTHFNASGNNLENIHEIIQHLSPTIEVLDVSGNFIGTLDATSFNKLKSLRRIYLSNTSLSIGDVNPFDHLTNLHTLEVNYNNLKNLNFTILSSTLNKLVWFEAAFCEITNAHDVIKLLAPSILKIDLSGNFVGEVNNNTFREFPKLIYLILSNTSLTNFDFVLLEHHSNLEQLDLSHNQLTRAVITTHLEHLKSLNLEDNELTEVQLARTQLPHLDSILISNNKLSCEYLLRLHREWPDLKIGGESWTQKKGVNCTSSDF